MPVTTGGVEEMSVRGDRAVVKISYGQLVEFDLVQLERDFSTLTHGDETASGAREMLRMLGMPGATIGDDALVPATTDTVHRGGKMEVISGWDFALHNQMVPRIGRRGALIDIHGQWDLDVIDAATREIAFTTHLANGKVNSLTAPDSADVLVNDLVRVDELGGRRLAVFNATLIGPTHRETAWEGGAVVDVSDVHAPRVIAIDRRNAPLDTANLRYGWRSYIRDVVFARDAIVELEYDGTRILRFDDDGRMIRIDSTGRFVGRLVPGPDGTVVELSVESSWRDTRRASLADTTAPAIRIRTTTPRLAMREAPAAIPVDERGRSTVSHRLRFEVVSPFPAADPAQLSLRAATSMLLPARRAGALLEASLPAGTVIGSDAITLTLDAGGATGRWIALGVTPMAFGANAVRSVVALDDPFTNLAVVVADSGANSTANAAFTDPRLRVRLRRDSAATIFVVAGSESATLRVVRRDRGRADVAASRSTTVTSYPAAASSPSLAALRHLGRNSELNFALCLRDALGKRVKRTYSSLPEGQWNLWTSGPYAPCGDAAQLRAWITRRGGAVVEGPSAAVVAGRRELPPADTLVPRSDRRRWATARAEIITDSTLTWAFSEPLARQGADSAQTAPPDDIVQSGLSPAERATVANTLADVALLSVVGTVYSDSTDSTVAVIRNEITPWLVPDSSAQRNVFAMADDGSRIYGDWSTGRFVPRWERWGYGTMVMPQLLDLDGDGRAEFVFTSYSHDAKGHVVSQELWAFDEAGRELTRQAVNELGLTEREALPISSDVTDSEYCESSDCGGIVVGRPGTDGSRPLITSEGRWTLRDGRYVFTPNPPPPPKPKPAAKRKPKGKRAPLKP